MRTRRDRSDRSAGLCAPEPAATPIAPLHLLANSYPALVPRDESRSRSLTAEVSVSRQGEPVDGREPVDLPAEQLNQREAAFIKLLAEAIASDIRRGGTLADEPLDEPDEEVSATAEETAAEVRKAEEAGDEP